MRRLFSSSSFALNPGRLQSTAKTTGVGLAVPILSDGTVLDVSLMN